MINQLKGRELNLKWAPASKKKNIGIISLYSRTISRYTVTHIKSKFKVAFIESQSVFLYRPVHVNEYTNDNHKSDLGLKKNISTPTE